MQELRRNPMTRKWILYLEPSMELDEIHRTISHWGDWNPPFTEQKDCPFCPGNEELGGKTILLYDKGEFYFEKQVTGRTEKTWQVRVVPHPNPLFRIERGVKRWGYRFFDIMEPRGANEVVINTPDHERDIYSFQQDEIATILRTCHERYIDLKNDPQMGHFLFFIGYGGEAGSVYKHSITQIIVAPYVPEKVQKELDGAKHWYEQKERCLFCDIMDEEYSKRETGKTHQIIAENELFIAIVPFFASHPFEIWILPKEHQSDYSDMTYGRFNSLAELVNQNLNRLHEILGKIPFTLTLLTQPNKAWGKARGYWSKIEQDWHWRLLLVPRLHLMGDLHRGYFLATGSRINPVHPEQAAAMLRL